MKIAPIKIKRIFEYLSAHDLKLKPADGAFVFCRDDPLLARRISELFKANLINYALLTGGVGKDSGKLPELGLSESDYQASLLTKEYNISKSKLYVESCAKNGIENSLLGIDKIIKNNLPHDNLIIIVHPTQARRIYAVHQNIARKKQFHSTYQLAITNYKFDPNNPVDQKEAVMELLKINEITKMGICDKQKDIPKELIEYSRMTGIANDIQKHILEYKKIIERI